jgi:hypothetical protein
MAGIGGSRPSSVCVPEDLIMVTTTIQETLAMPLDGRSRAAVRLEFGGGELTLHQAEPGMLVSGRFEGGVVTSESTTDEVHLEPSHVRPFRPVLWDVGLTAEIPVALRLDTGANRSVLDLSTLRIRSLELNTGASETTVRLPALGQTRVHVSCGFAAVFVDVPEGVAARVHGRVMFGGTKVDQRRFPRAADGWASPDFDTAANRVDIEVEGGFGSVEVR